MPLNVNGLPLIKPPYGTISAISLDKGEIVWQIAHGDTPDAIRNNPALKGITLPARTGQSGYNVGTLITKSLVIAPLNGVAEKSPARSAAVGTVTASDDIPCTTRRPSYEVKKKVRSFTIGPPKVPPNWFCLSSGRRRSR